MNKVGKQVKKLAVLLTGVPRGYERCVATLKFMLGEWDVSFFAVIREEFASEQVLDGLAVAYPGVKTVVVPKQVSADAIASLQGRRMAPTVAMMWHEVAFGAQAIDRPFEFDAMLRVRFDIYFHRQFLPEFRLSEDDVLLPAQMSWSGANDMICLALPQAFMRYAGTWNRLSHIFDEGGGIPEVIAARSLTMAGLIEQRLNIMFILYRDALVGGLTDEQLRILAHVSPGLSTYKVGGANDTPEHRAKAIEAIGNVTRREAGFPLYLVINTDSNFHSVEIDARDGSAFRWMGLHAHMNVAVPRDAKKLSFVIHFWIAGWVLSHLTLLVDGFPVRITQCGTDHHGRKKVEGSLEGIALRRPWSRLGFSSRYLVVPSKEGSNRNDHRTLSIAIGSLALDGNLLSVADGRA